ncbi:hypothetical protein PQR65_37350 [Paraburkholderia nemoris]|uniref:hypothetical protein n=1 Tax=Paraburkholderia nemoris TaxID=2793076 RepID=UPI0038BD8E49
MTNHRKEQTRDAGRERDRDKQPVDTPDPGAGPPAPDTAPPILQSEDDELSDEDAPE